MSWPFAAAAVAIVGIMASALTSIFSKKPSNVCKELFEKITKRIDNEVYMSECDRKGIRQDVVFKHEAVIRLDTEMKAVQTDISEIKMILHEMSVDIQKIFRDMPKRIKNSRG